MWNTQPQASENLYLPQHALFSPFFSLHFVHCTLPVLFISPFQHACPSLSHLCSIYLSFHSLTPSPVNTFIISSPICIFCPKACQQSSLKRNAHIQLTQTLPFMWYFHDVINSYVSPVGVLINLLVSVWRCLLQSTCT